MHGCVVLVFLTDQRSLSYKALKQMHSCDVTWYGSSFDHLAEALFVICVLYVAVAYCISEIFMLCFSVYEHSFPDPATLRMSNKLLVPFLDHLPRTHHFSRCLPPPPPPPPTPHPVRGHRKVLAEDKARGGGGGGGA